MRETFLFHLHVPGARERRYRLVSIANRHCREGERNSVFAIIDWGQRVYKAKQSLQISFREWVENCYQSYSHSSLVRLAKIGENADELVRIAHQKEVANDWYTLYQMIGELSTR